jgi:endonuclease YncB( thermonuclease family)
MVSYDSTGKDLYGRVLADIWLNNQRLDSTLISNGWAWHYQLIVMILFKIINGICY